MSELEQLRGDIDAIDRQIVDLMKRRMETVAQVAEYKKANNMPVLDTSRERALLSKVGQEAGEELADYVQSMYRTIMAASRSYENGKLGRGSKVYDGIKKAMESNPLSEEIEKFNAAGGAFILVNLKNNEVLNSASISILESFDYNRDYSYTPNNVMKLLKKERLATTQQFIEDYTAFIKSAGKKELEELRGNVTNRAAKKINIEGISIYGLTATDYKLDNPDDVVTTFLGHFSYQGQEYALITFLDAPKGIKSTYNFNSSGWNATELARKIVESVVLNANLAKR